MNIKAVSLLDFYQSIEEYVKSQNPELTSPKTIRKKARAIFCEIASQKISFGQNTDMQNYLECDALVMELSHRSKNFILCDFQSVTLRRCVTNKPPAMRVRIEGYTKKTPIAIQ